MADSGRKLGRVVSTRFMVVAGRARPRRELMSRYGLALLCPSGTSPPFHLHPPQHLCLCRGMAGNAIVSIELRTAVARAIRAQLAAQWQQFDLRLHRRAGSSPPASALAVVPPFTRGPSQLAQTTRLMQQQLSFAPKRHFPGNLSAESARVARSAAAHPSPPSHLFSLASWLVKAVERLAGSRGSLSVDRS